MYISILSPKNQLRLLKLAYKVGDYLRLKPKQVTKRFLNQTVKSIPADLADELAEKIQLGVPFLLARLGGTEGTITGQYCEIKNGLRKQYQADTVRWMYSTSGFFMDEEDDKEKALDRYAELTLDGLKDCDYLSAMFPPRIYMPFLFANYAKKAVPTFSDFSPSFDKETRCTWYRGLAGKRVLVVNSFADSISYQYKRKHLLVRESSHALPDFQLLTYKTAVTQVGERFENYRNFFDVLKRMEDDIAKLDFDVALVGAGAYGFPLSVAIRRMGRIAIETCGSTPLYFGIYGERFVRHGLPDYVTDAWIRPMETPPKNYKQVEGGCYW